MTASRPVLQASMLANLLKQGHIHACVADAASLAVSLCCFWLAPGSSHAFGSSLVPAGVPATARPSAWLLTAGRYRHHLVAAAR